MPATVFDAPNFDPRPLCVYETLVERNARYERRRTTRRNVMIGIAVSAWLGLVALAAMYL